LIRWSISQPVEEKAAGETIDVGSGTLVPVRQVVKEIYALIPGALPHGVLGSWIRFPADRKVA
jgi:hypothetical protein